MDISFDLNIKAPADKVYEALSTESGIKGWWSKDCRVGEKEGEKTLLKFNKGGNIVGMSFETQKLKPRKRVVWECTENVNPAWMGTRLSTKISETSDGVKVEFVHEGFSEKWVGLEAFESTRQGWEHFMNSLVNYCEKGQGDPW